MPGPKKTLYFKDAKLISMCPLSTMTPGGGVNITMITYNNIAQIGIVCCNRDIKCLEPLAQYSLEAFDMLEACVDDPALNIEDIGEVIDEHEYLHEHEHELDIFMSNQRDIYR